MTPGVFFNETRTHVPDPYDEFRRLEAAERREHKAKQADTKPFVGMATTGKAFSKDREVYDTGEGEAKPSPKPKRLSVSCDHGNHPFKPASGSRTSKHDTFEAFPEYRPNPLTFAARKDPDEKRSPGWKPIYTPKSVPVSSVIGHKRVLRRELRSLQASVNSLKL
jgi:hypothetical protein